MSIKLGTTNIAGIPTGLINTVNNKVDLNASNLNTDGKSLISGLGMPSSRYIALTLGASGSAYTAPANGWFTVDITTNGTNQRFGFYNSQKHISTNVFVPQTNNAIRTYVPVTRGDVVLTNYSAGGTVNTFRFIYAEGEQ